MIDFSHLAKLTIDEEALAEYTFPEIPGAPSIFFAVASDLNNDFLNARLRLSAEQAAADAKAPKKPVQGPVPNAETIKANAEDARERDRVIIARACAKKWGTPPADRYGAQPDFSEENCYAFFRALPVWLFDPLRTWVQNIYNFAPTITTIDGDVADEVGNS